MVLFLMLSCSCYSLTCYKRQQWNFTAAKLGLCIPVPVQLALVFGHCRMEIFFSYKQMGLDPSSLLTLPIYQRW